MNQVRVVNQTGNPKDTMVWIGRKMLPLSHMMSVDIRVRPDEVITAHVELRVDDLNVLAKANTLPEPKI